MTVIMTETDRGRYMVLRYYPPHPPSRQPWLKARSSRPSCCSRITNRTHVLLLMGTVMTYSIVAIGLVALGAHVNRAILRVLQAIDGITTV